MKKIKVFFNGKRLRDIYPYATKWEVFKWKLGKFFRKVVIWSVGITALWFAFFIGGMFNPQTVFLQAQQENTIPPILQRISGCETKGDASAKGTHYAKSGQVLLNANVNNTVDVGKYQINSVWFAKATELGLDITEEEDNEEMAMWIYQNRGTGDWAASSNCWKK